MPSKTKNILFLNLYAFSLAGGVEKVSKNFIYTLRQLFGADKLASYSMHDRTADIDVNFTANSNYRAFAGAKISFIFSSVYKAFSCPTVILSHINLLLVAKLISFFKPKHRFILFAHGIEVWGQLAKWKVSFIKRNVEVWSVSNYTRDKMISQHQLKPDKVQVLHNSLSPFLTLPADFEKPEHLIERYKIAPGNRVLFTLNRLSASEKYKGYDTVITALAKLKAEDSNFTYLLAGKADQSEQLRVQQLINDYGLNDCVKVIGYLAEEEITDHFLLADIFIMPSKGEGFGMVFIEAAAHGCQVIAGNTDGSTDALLKGKLGQLVDPNNEDEIIEAIQIALVNHRHQPEKQQQLTIEHFGFDQYVKKVGKLIDNY